VRPTAAVVFSGPLDKCAKHWPTITPMTSYLFACCVYATGKRQTGSVDRCNIDDAGEERWRAWRKYHRVQRTRNASAACLNPGSLNAVQPHFRMVQNSNQVWGVPLYPHHKLINYIICQPCTAHIVATPASRKPAGNCGRSLQVPNRFRGTSRMQTPKSKPQPDYTASTTPNSQPYSSASTKPMTAGNTSKNMYSLPEVATAMSAACCKCANAGPPCCKR